MLDFHAHLLPGIDDGSKDTYMSLSMLKMWRDQGIGHICATPHFYADSNTPERFFANRKASYMSLISRINSIQGGEGAFPKIFLGAEVHYFRGMSNSEDIRKFCLQGTNLLLVEMPFKSWSDYMLRDISELRSIGIVPVAAHIERYFSYNSKSRIEGIVQMGALLQCNAEFFIENSTRRKALAMLERGKISFLGSDAHNLTTRHPNLDAALDIINGRLDPDVLSAIRRNETFVIEARRIAESRGVIFP